MPRHCTVCDHSDRAEIDAALVERQPFRDLAGRFRLSSTALHRERTPCCRGASYDVPRAGRRDSLKGVGRRVGKAPIWPEASQRLISGQPGPFNPGIGGVAVVALGPDVVAGGGVDPPTPGTPSNQP